MYDYSNNQVGGISQYGYAPAPQPTGQWLQSQNGYANQAYAEYPVIYGGCNYNLVQPEDNPLKKAVFQKMLDKQMQHEIIDHKADRQDSSAVLKSRLKNGEMDHKEELEEKKMRAQADIQLQKEHRVLSVNKDPKKANKLCLQYQDSSGTTILTDPICHAENIFVDKLKSYFNGREYFAYCINFNGEKQFYISEEAMSAHVLAERLHSSGYPILFRSSRKVETYNAAYTLLIGECKYRSIINIPFSAGWTYHYDEDGIHWRFYEPGSDVVFMSEVI